MPIQKKKLPLLQRLLLAETDEDHGLTLEEITQELMDTIRFVRKEFNMTILLIEHDMKLVSGICERLTVLNFGQVLASGETSQVLNNPQVITAYLGE